MKSSGFLGGSAVKNLLAKKKKKRISLPMQEMQETKFQSLGWGDSLEEEMATYSSILPGKSYGLRSRVGYIPWGHKDLMTKQQHSEVI